MLFAGIDWSDDHHDVVVLGPDRHEIGHRQVPHTAEGLDSLITWLHSLARPEDIACLVETRHGLLIQALLEAGLAVYPVNPRTVDRMRRPSRAKTDVLDAWLLARHGCNELDRIRRLEPDNPVVEELKTLSRDQLGLIKQRSRVLQQLTAGLKAYYPLALSLFSQLNQPVTLDFLARYPNPDALAAATTEEVTEFLRDHHYPRAADKARHITDQAQGPQLSASPALARAKTQLTLALVVQLRTLNQSIDRYDQLLQTLYLEHPDHELFASLPGCGERLGPRLLGEWGDDRSRYQSAEGVAALAGTSPAPFQSGRYRGVRKRLACIKPFRDACYRMAWSSTRWEPWAQDYYQRKRSEGKSHTQAVRALSNIWVRIIYRMWVNRTPYDRERFLKAQSRHARIA